MKHLLIIFLILTSHFTYANEEDIKGYLSCKINSMDNTYMGDGKFVKEINREWGIQKNDVLKLEYEYTFKISSLFFYLKGIQVNSNIGYTIKSEYDGKYFMKSYASQLDGEFSENNMMLELREDSRKRGVNDYKMILTRYFKNDWTALITNSNSFSAQVVTLQCNNKTSDKFYKILEHLQSKEFKE